MGRRESGEGEGRGETLGARRRIAAPRRHDDRFHTVIAGDRIDLLAWRYLGDARLWWIIADYNDIFFPLELEPGALLRILSIAIIYCYESSSGDDSKDSKY